MLVDLGIRQLQTTAPPRCQFPRGHSSRRFVELPAAPAQLNIGIVATETSLGEQHRNVRSRGAESTLAGIEEHVREARFERQCGYGAAMGRYSSLVVDRAECPQSLSRLIQRG